ncbi:granulocyte colony-stimulating factor isoform X1 [Dasypus novemcinctus]|uniref:granulocyte colony-stimulating factor isoform X1 n=1 Tax=Dasypus novemcinctus TaxID=9361 RepID=UPI00265FDE15|nr:granulocyte colony-stimulating factor isoform X1 [Dasypus novemcinctus]
MGSLGGIGRNLGKRSWGDSAGEVLAWSMEHGWTGRDGLRSLLASGGKGTMQKARRTQEGREAWRGPPTQPPSHLQCATHKLCHPEELVLLGHILGIPQAPLSSCSSQALQLTDCLSQLHRGLFLYQGLLQALAGTSPEVTPTLDFLLLDITDFATNIWQQMEDLGVAPAAQPTQGTTPHFTSAFQRRAGAVLVASNLQSFLELAYRALHYLDQP